MESEHLVEIASVFESTLTETVDTNHLIDLIEKNEMSVVKQSEHYLHLHENYDVWLFPKYMIFEILGFFSKKWLILTNFLI